MNKPIEMKKGKHAAFVKPEDVDYHKSKGFKVVGEKPNKPNPIKEAEKEDKE